MLKSSALLALLATGCVLEATDEDTLETESSELIYCPDGLCDPPEPLPATLYPDLAPAPALTACHFVYTEIPTRGYKIGLRVFNNGTARAPASTARVRFKVTYNNTITPPIDVSVPALDPGTYTTHYVMANTYCWNSLPGCDIMVTADASKVVAELSESNNATTWHCSK